MLRPSLLSPDILWEASLTSDDLYASPIAINGMKLLHYASHQAGIPLTKTTGAFHRKCVEWAAEDFQWPGFEPSILYSVNKVLNEPDFPPLSMLHDVLLKARLLRHYKGKAVLTKAGMNVLGQYGELQVIIADRLLDGPYWEYLPTEAKPIFWDLKHMLGVIGHTLGDWVTAGQFTEWVIPVELFPAAGPLGPRFEASLYVSSNIIRPLYWLGLLELAERPHSATRVEDRLIRRSPLFGRAVHRMLPGGGSETEGNGMLLH